MSTNNAFICGYVQEKQMSSADSVGISSSHINTH